MITYLSGILNGDKLQISVTAVLPLPAGMSIAQFLSTLSIGPFPNASPVSEPAAATTASTEAPPPATETTRRRRRTAAEMEAARAAENPTSATSVEQAGAEATQAGGTAASGEGTSRRRRVHPVDPMPITDAELSKAASHTADELVKIGEDGPGLVMAVLEDYQVKAVGEIAVDRREAFIKELAKELDLAQQEHASKQ